MRLKWWVVGNIISSIIVLLVVKLNWQLKVEDEIQLLVSIASIIGMIIALLQLQRGNQKQQQDLANLRFKDTMHVFEFFVQDIILLTHAVERKAIKIVIRELMAKNITDLSAIDSKSYRQLVLTAKAEANIDEVFNKLEFQAMVIQSGTIDDQQLIGMFANSIKTYCMTNATAFEHCKQSRNYVQLERLIQEWGYKDD